MKRHLQRGTIDNSPLLWIVPILAAVAWYSWPGRPEIFTPTVIKWLVAGGAVLAAIFVVALLLHLREQAHKKNVAKAVGSELTPEFQRRGWGQSDLVYYIVPMQRHGHKIKLVPSRRASSLTLEVVGGHADPFRMSVTPAGEIRIEDAGRGAAEAFLDERVRANLVRMARVGTTPADPAVVVSVGRESLFVSRDGTMSVRETLLFLNLSWPIIDRALAQCFGKPVSPPGRICATCGGECCATCDTEHAPACGCNRQD